MPEYNSNLRALNNVVADYGLPGGHHFEVDALNAWAVHLGGSGGHQFNIDALNEIIGLVEGSGSFQFEIDAYNEISQALGGRSDFQFVEDALSEISDLPVFEGGGWILEGALIDLDFENGRYYMDGSERSLGEILTGTPINIIEGQGLDERADFEEIIRDPSRGFGTAAVLAILQSNLATGFTVYTDHTDETADDGASSHEFFGLYDITDPTEADNGDAIELWFKTNHGALAIDDWVNTGDFNSSTTNVVAAGRNKSAITLNLPLGGGIFRHSLCLNGDTPVNNDVALDYTTQHFNNQVQSVSFGFRGGSDSTYIRGIVHRQAILLPRSNAQMQTLTTA